MRSKILFVFSIIALSFGLLHAMHEELNSEQSPCPWNAKEYEQLSELTFESGIALLGELMNYTNCIENAKGTILEIGCGVGRLAVHMAGQVFPFGHVVAVDNNESMLNEAKRNKKSNKVKNITLINKNACDLKYNQQFDLAIAVHSIQWTQSLEDIIAIMKVVTKSLKPTGLFGAIFSIKHTNEHPIPAEQALQEIIESPQWAHYYEGEEGKKYFRNNLDLDDYNQALEQAGLIGKAKILKRNNRYVLKEKLIKGLRGLPFTKAIPQDQIDDFFKDLLSKFDEFGLKNEAGKYQIGWDIGIIIAHKQQTS